MMFKKFINEEETFAINEDMEISIEEIVPGGPKLLIADDFYKNPELVRDLALLIPPTVNERIQNSLPFGPDSGRLNAFYRLDHFGVVYDNLIRLAYPELTNDIWEGSIIDSFTRATFMVNVMTSNNLPPRVPHIDHLDNRAFASLIYLNTPEECAGGTAFYSFGGATTANEAPTTIDVEKKIPPDHFIASDVGDWKIEKIAEMKFNRMLLYQQTVFHSAYIKEGMFTNGIYRLNQQFFI